MKFVKKSWFKKTTSVILTASLIGLSAQAVTFAEERNTLTNKEINCLAKNVYFEAKNQGTGGWLAVAFVTLNRVKIVGFLILYVK